MYRPQRATRRTRTTSVWPLPLQKRAQAAAPTHARGKYERESDETETDCSDESEWNMHEFDEKACGELYSPEYASFKVSWLRPIIHRHHQVQ